MVKEYRYLFLVSTEHQLIQVRMAIQYFDLNPDKIILYAFRTNKDSIDEENIKLYTNIENIKVFKNWTFKDLLFQKELFKDYFQCLNELQIVKNILWVFTSQYFSDYSNLAYSILRPDKFFLMDEGTASFRVAEYRNKILRIDAKNFIKTLLYGRLLSFPTRITYFTQYSLKVKQTDSLDFYKFELIDNTNFLVNQREAIFLGSSLVELNLIDKIIYLNILTKIRNDLGKRNCYYYAHRKENAIKLDEIRKLGFQIVLNSKPFEFLFSEFKIYPSLICSFYSPVLDTLTKQFKHIPNFIIYRFDLKYLKKNKKIVKMILDSFECNSRIKIIDI